MESKQERGFTLIEILISFTILTIVLVTFMAFFTQGFIHNNHNEQSYQSVNLAREKLFEIQHSIELKQFFLRPLTDSDDDSSPVLDETNYPLIQHIQINSNHPFYELTLTNNVFPNYSFIAKIDKIPSYDSDQNSPFDIEMFKIKLEVYNDKNQLLTYTYGYIEEDI